MNDMLDGLIDVVSRPERSAAIDFTLPAELEAGEPPEARGLARDDVRLMVSHYGSDSVAHTIFHTIPEHLGPGDLVVLNTSGTINGAIGVTAANGDGLELHVSTVLPDGLRTVELRRIAGHGTLPHLSARPGERFGLDGGGTMTLLAPYRTARNGTTGGGSKNGDGVSDGVRLWVAAFDLPRSLDEHLADYGYPIRYNYVRREWPLDFYQTVYATEPGSSEMPSAGRAITHELLTRMVAQGTMVAPILLHTGVASLEDDEPPYEEYYRVPAATARLVNLTRRSGGRVIAVGTTVVRALESRADEDGIVYPGEGWTDLVIGEERGIRAVDGLLTGLHEPRASHLAMLRALAGREHIGHAYAEALRERYLWHEFGDLHLILP